MKHTKEFKEQVISEYEIRKMEDGFSVEEYVKEQGISRASFYKWLDKKNKIPVDVTSLIKSSESKSITVEVSKCNIIVKRGYDEELLLEIIGSLKKI